MTAANSTIFQHAIGSTRLCSMQNIVIMVIIVMQASSHIASQLQLARCAIAIVPFENWDEETKKKTHTDSNSLAGQSSNYLSIIPIHDFRSGHRFIWNRARNKAHFFLSTPFTMRFLSMMKTTRNFLYIQQQTPQQNERFQEIFKLCEIRRQSKVVNAFGIGWYN